MLGDGPDGDADPGPDLLDRFDAVSIQAQEAEDVLRANTYNPANGLKSNGDIWRPVIAPEFNRGRYVAGDRATSDTFAPTAGSASKAPPSSP